MNELPSPAWHAISASDAASELASDVQAGLSSAGAALRLGQRGPNIITTRKGRPWWLQLLLQFHAPLVYIMIVAGAVTMWLGEYVDSGVILGVVLINAVVGFVQENRAVKAIDALARSMRIEATVRRDGQRRGINAADLVRGDIVLLEPGDKVPADLRLLVGHEICIDESTLTGESKAVAKLSPAEPLPAETVLADRTNMAYAGSLVTRGTGEGVVVATADATEVGRISGMIASAEEIATPLTKKIASFSRVIMWLVLAVAVITFIVGLMRGNPPVEMFEAAVALSVGAIPEGLPAAVTIMLAVGVSRMARRKAIIRTLAAVEALGSTTVICSDKTGTLTQNQMTVRSAWVAGGVAYEFDGAGYNPTGVVRVAGAAAAMVAADHPALVEMLRCGALCNDAAILAHKGTSERWTIRGDPTEAAMIVAARKAGLSPEALARGCPRVDVIPFESDRQYMATLHQCEGTGNTDSTGRTIYVKGSVERVLGMCQRAMDSRGSDALLERDAVHAAAADLARRGLRVLAFARGHAQPGVDDLTHPMVEKAENGLTFLGVQGMLDPPREEAMRAVAACQRAGVRVKMITGDHALTAASIAGMIGIDGAGSVVGIAHRRVLTGADMAAISDEDLPAQAEATAVFARMTPEQKLRLVKALQTGVAGRKHIVAMTGDGVNDAPALRQADIGVAMGTAGTEVAKDAADIVLADDNFASIEAAIEEGRGVYDNLTKFIVWTLPTNGEALAIIVAIGMGWPLPILPVQALYINMVTAILLGMPLIFEAREPGVMDRPPRDPARPLLTFELFMRTGLVSVILCVGALLLFQWQVSRGMGEAAARTAAVSVIVVGELFYLFPSRALLRPAWSVPLFSNMWLWAGIAAMLAVQFAFAHAPVLNRLFHSAPLDASAWMRVLAAGAAVLVVVEIEKGIRRAIGTVKIDAST